MATRYFHNTKDGGVIFLWNNAFYTKPAGMKFPVVVLREDAVAYTIREATVEDHKLRARLAFEGRWERVYQIGRRSKLKWWFFEWTHALKNVVVERSRARGTYNRGNRDPNVPDGYVVPEGLGFHD